MTSTKPVIFVIGALQHSPAGTSWHISWLRPKQQSLGTDALYLGSPWPMTYIYIILYYIYIIYIIYSIYIYIISGPWYLNLWWFPCGRIFLKRCPAHGGQLNDGEITWTRFVKRQSVRGRTMCWEDPKSLSFGEKKRDNESIYIYNI